MDRLSIKAQAHKGTKMTQTIYLPDVEFSTQFQPCAVFDVHLDCIRVLTRNASVREVRVDGDLTVFRENFPSGFGSSIVGFSLKGVNHLMHELGFDSGKAYKLSELLDAIVKLRPTTTMSVILDLFRDLGDVKETEIKFSQPIAA
jgi:hypothetical protein